LADGPGGPKESVKRVANPVRKRERIVTNSERVYREEQEEGRDKQAKYEASA